MLNLLNRYPALSVCSADLQAMLDTLVECYSKGHKLLICGNGGSAADAEHIVGELMKGFRNPRKISKKERQRTPKLFIRQRVDCYNFFFNSYIPLFCQF